jgi:L-fuconolactonase
MRIDSHQHFWHYNPVDHAWMSEAMGTIKRDFLPEDLKPLLESIGFDGCVAVQARQNLDETRWLLALAERNTFIRGVVGWVDLRSKHLPAQLAEFASHPRLVGVRHVVHDEPDDRFMIDQDFRRGISQLAEFGLAYDLLLFPKHLPVAVELVKEFPYQRFVLDHIAKPRTADGLLSPWQEDLMELAGYDNVTCKLSGMVTEGDWASWKAGDFQRYLDVVFAAFDPNRLMIGSDWPVCTAAASYATTMQIVIDYLQPFSGEVQAGILGDNCARIYKIRD